MAGISMRVMALFLVIVLACAPLAASADVLRRGNEAEPGTLDPQLATAVREARILGDMYVGLMTEDARGEAIYGAAASHELSRDLTEYTFTLRGDGRWSDGEPVTAQDFVLAFRRLMSPAFNAPYASLGDVIRNGRAVRNGDLPVEELGVRATADDTLVVALEQPAAYLLELLTNPAFFPLPAHVVAERDTPMEPEPGNVSNGPFVLASWDRNDRVVLEKNPEFFDADAVTLDAVEYVVTQNVGDAFNRFKGGDLDVNVGYPVNQAEWLDDELPGARRTSPSLTLTYVAFNTRRPPFDDARVRNAVSLMIDRETLVTNILQGDAAAAWTVVPPGVAGYQNLPDPPQADWSDAQRGEEARRLLSEAGYQIGEVGASLLTFNLRHIIAGDDRRRAMALRAMWRANSHSVARPRLEGGDVSEHYARVGEGDFDAAVARWLADYNEASSFLFLFRAEAGQLNFSGYDSPAYEQAMSAADAAADVEARAALLAEAERIVLLDAPIAPLSFNKRRALVGAHVDGWVDNVKGIQRSRWLSLQPRLAAGGE